MNMDEDEYNALPQEVKDVLDGFGETTSYTECQQVQFALSAIGWTCDYGLDASIYDVKRI